LARDPVPAQGERAMTAAEAARSIFEHAVRSSSIAHAFAQRFSPTHRPWKKYKHIYAIAVGKAALPMLDTLRSLLPRDLDRGVCCAPLPPEHPIPRIEYYVGGHPLPNKDSFASAEAALHLLRGSDASDFVFFLISGGGSAMFEQPLSTSISLDETRTFYQSLVGSGGTIAEINAVRKHFSAVKGGRLAAAAPDAEKLTLLVSDVAPKFLDALASGPTLPDTSTVAECRKIIERYHLEERFPPALVNFFADPALPETPQIHGSPVEILLSSEDLLKAAQAQAQTLGYKVLIDNTCDDWDYNDAARYLLQRFAELRQEHPRLCLLSAGEVTVRLPHAHGTGGRNQQFALSCALAGHDVLVLSAGSDGIDGNSVAAGAIADSTTVERARALGIDAQDVLARFDAYPMFAALGDLLVTGPTHNNLRDLRILLSTSSVT
jgi:glycerate 2-kinase